MRFFILAALLGGSLSAQAAINVTDSTDTVDPADNKCTLREAVSSANTNTASGSIVLYPNECQAGVPGHDDIQLPAGTYVLAFTSHEDGNASGDLDITEDLGITGANSASTIIEGGTGFNDRLVHVLNDVPVWLAKLTLRQGNALSIPPTFNGGPYGGAVLNDGSGTLTLAGVVAVSNSAQAGGGVYSQGWLQINSDSQVCNNLAKFDGTTGNAWGGGIFSLGDTILSYSKVCLNKVEVIATTSATLPATNNAYGGGIYSQGNTTIDHSEISNNTAEINTITPPPGNGLGGGIYIENNMLTVQASELHDNAAKAPTTASGYGAKGAGIYVGPGGSALIQSSSKIYQNKADAYESHGGGIYHGAGGKNIIVDNSSIDGNEALSGGGIYVGDSAGLVLQNGAAVSHNIANRSGGGVYLLFNSTLNAINTTISGNQAKGISALWGGGGIYMHPFGTVSADLLRCTVNSNVTASNGGGVFVGSSGSSLTLSNSTISDNKANGSSPSSGGGGIYNNGNLTLESCTIAVNTALNGNGGGIHSTSGASAILHNTLVASNLASSGPDLSGLPGTFNSGGYNLICSDPLTIFSTGIGDLVGVTPNLGPLQYNGGFTYTHAFLLSSSPGVDQGDPALTGGDQRNETRAPTPDIGAFEYTPGNHAPFLDDSGSPYLGVIQEDETNPPGLTITQVISKFYGFQVSDTDVGDIVGLAIIGADNSHGTWQYKLDSTSTWLSMGGVSSSNALLLSPSAQIRFLPAANQNSSSGDPWIRFHAWDQTSGGSTADISTSTSVGGSTAFSSTSQSATLSINPINDPPVFTPGGNRSHPVGTSGTQTVTGWATGIGPGGGNDESSQHLTFNVNIVSNSGPILTDVPSISSTGTLTYNLMSGLSGSATVQVYLQDDGPVGTPHNNASSPITFTITVGAPPPPVNRAPILDPSGDPALPAVLEDAVAPPAIDIVALRGMLAGSSDPDGDPVGLAITGADSSHGVWEYDLGAGWLPLGAVSETSARLLSASARLRFLPAKDFNGLLNPALTFRAWDHSIGANGGLADAQIHGGSSAFSSARETASLRVKPANDAPAFTAGGSLSHPAGTLGAQSVAGWASGFSLGPPDEQASQAVSGFILVILADPKGVLAQASLTADGTLNYSLSGQSGVAHLRAVLQDNGGTLDGGQDRSAPADFSIQVAAPPPLVFYPLHISINGNGQVSSTPAGISCGADCAEDFQANTQITLTAQAAAGSQFAGWGGDCAGADETVSLTVDSAKHCAARFAVIPLPVAYPVRVSVIGSGQVSSTPAGINCGADCEENLPANTKMTLTAQAATGSQFAGWAGDCAGTDETVSLTVDSAKHCAARFAVIPLPVAYPVRVSVIGSGQVSSTPAGINCGADCADDFQANSQITLSAQPGADSQFAGWAGDCAGTDKILSLTVDSAKTCVARFAAILPPVVWPELALFDNGHALESGGHSDLGTLQPGQAVVRAFTVRNSGQADLLLHTPVFSAPGFSLASDFPNRVAPGAEAVFLVSFQAPWGRTAQQTITAVLSFASNDSDEARFEIYLSAQVLPDTTQPEPEPVPIPEPTPDRAVELNSAPLVENRPAGTPAGRLFTRGGNTDETYTYRLISGDTDAFFIQGDLLFTTRRLDYEAQQVFSLEIESTDSQGRTSRQTFKLSLLPQSIPADEVVAGWKHTCALRNGAVACWGWNNFGQATPPEDLDAVRQLSAGTTHTCALLDTGALTCWGNNQSGQAKPPAGREFIQISAGGQHSCALLANGQAVCWGYDFNGQAKPPTASRFIQIAAGGFHTCGLRADHGVECWGWNNHGQAAPPDTQDFARIATGEYHTCGLTLEGRARCWGRDFHGQASPPDLSGLVEISAGEEHSCAVHRDGYAVCWGLNSDGQATPPWDNREMAATRTGGYYTCGLYRDASLQCWGESDHGQAMPPATPPNRAPSGITLAPTTLSAGAPIGSVAGMLSSVDLDPADTHTYRLAEADALFSIEGDRLLTAATLPESGEYRVRVISNDGHNGEYEAILVVYAE